MVHTLGVDALERRWIAAWASGSEVPEWDAALAQMNEDLAAQPTLATPEIDDRLASMGFSPMAEDSMAVRV